MITDSFRSDCQFIFNKLKDRHSFSFSKYADAEFLILTNQSVTTIDGWFFTPELHEETRNLVFESFTYDDPNYFVGISCICCQPKNHVDWMRSVVGTKNVTWANIFVNDNHNFFIENFIPEFSNWDVNIICTSEGNISNLPFVPKSVTNINKQSITEDLHLVDQLEKLAMGKNGELFLFCAGPLGNILAHRLHLVNPNNTYLDIGSTLNGYLLENPNRHYITCSDLMDKKVCIW